MTVCCGGSGQSADLGNIFTPFAPWEGVTNPESQIPKPESRTLNHWISFSRPSFRGKRYPHLGTPNPDHAKVLDVVGPSKGNGKKYLLSRNCKAPSIPQKLPDDQRNVWKTINLFLRYGVGVGDRVEGIWFMVQGLGYRLEQVSC